MCITEVVYMEELVVWWQQAMQDCAADQNVLICGFNFYKKMQSKRSFRHLIFWTFFFIISVFNELYFSNSFSEHPNWDSFLNSILSQTLLYSIKALVVYYSIYSIIPKWSAHQSTMSAKSMHVTERSSLKYLLEFIFVLLAGAF
ncbi:MAG: hypothetical protein WAT91_10500, partial [Saprospiraceae bacterium]